jgi:uncharacterized protein YraI
VTDTKAELVLCLTVVTASVVVIAMLLVFVASAPCSEKTGTLLNARTAWCGPGAILTVEGERYTCSCPSGDP